MVSARARRGMVDYAVSRGASIRHACALLQVSRSTLGYTSRLEARDAELAPMLQEIAFRHRGYGYRFAWALLRRQGQIVNHKRVRRIWRSLGLTWADGKSRGRSGQGRHESSLLRDRTKCGPTTSFMIAAGTGSRSRS
jgi:putative transposase